MSVKNLIQAGLFSLLFTITSQNSSAAWVTLHENSPEDKFMVEDQTIKKIGAKITFWALSNFIPKPGDEQVGRSGITNFEGDCEKRTLQVVYMRFHKESNARGEVTMVMTIPVSYTHLTLPTKA